MAIPFSVIVYVVRKISSLFSFHFLINLKPIFHCDAKLFALGTGICVDPQRHNFTSPNAKYTNMLVYFGIT